MCSADVTPAAAWTTCSTSVSPPARCRTLARLDFIRVPRPAARITTLSGDVIRFLLFRSEDTDFRLGGSAAASQFQRYVGDSSGVVTHNFTIGQQVPGNDL